MKKAIFLLLLLLNQALSAQDFWTPTGLSMTAYGEYNKPLLSVADDHTIWVTNTAPNGDTSWHWSTDGGDNWNSGIFALDHPTDLVYAICALSATTAYVAAGTFDNAQTIVGTGVYKTIDSGATWVKQTGIFTTPAISFAHQVHFWDANQGVAIGDPENGFFEIYTTNNAGTNWTRVPSANIDTVPLLYEYPTRITVDGDRIWFLTSQQRLFRSDDNGLHWQGFDTPLMDFAPVETFEFIAFKNQNEGLLISYDWRYFKTIDGGETWAELSNSATGHFCARNGNAWYIPETPDSYFFTSLKHDMEQLGTSYSNNGGLSFQNMNLMDDDPIIVTQAYFKNSDLAYSIGSYISDGGDSLQFTVFKHGETNAGFANNLWTEINPLYSFPTYKPAQISIADANVVWVRGTHESNPNLTQRFSHSSDSGQSWTDGIINVGSSSLRITSICGVSATTAYVTAATPTGGSGGGVWKTTDAGATWTKQNSASFNSSDSYAKIVHFWNANDGVVIGDPEGGYFEVYTTANGGTNWTRVPAENFPVLFPTTDYPILNFDAKGNSIWFVTHSDQVYRSDDKGLHWTLCQGIVRDMDGIYFTTVAFKNPSHGLFLRTDSILANTSNGGDNWQIAFPTDAYYVGGISDVPETPSTYFSWGFNANEGNRGSSFSTDAGMTWHDMNQEDTNPLDISSAKFHNSQMGYCIAKYIGQTEIKFFRLNYPGDRLLKNEVFKPSGKTKVIAYPNPAANVVHLTGINFTRITIFDATGKSIFAQDYQGENEMAIDTAALRTGLYFIKATDENGLTATVKLVKR